MVKIGWLFVRLIWFWLILFCLMMSDLFWVMIYVSFCWFIVVSCLFGIIFVVWGMFLGNRLLNVLVVIGLLGIMLNLRFGVVCIINWLICGLNVLFVNCSVLGVLVVSGVVLSVIFYGFVGIVLEIILFKVLCIG